MVLDLRYAGTATKDGELGKQHKRGEQADRCEGSFPVTGCCDR